MKNNEIQELLKRGTATAISLHPDIKSEITRKAIESHVQEVRRHLASRKSAHLILIKE